MQNLTYAILDLANRETQGQIHILGNLSRGGKITVAFNMGENYHEANFCDCGIRSIW